MPIKNKVAKNKFRSDVRKGLFRIPISITEEMETWLHTLSTQMKNSGGYKLPKSYIVRSIINAMMKLDLNVAGVKKENELEDRFIEAIKNMRKE